MIEPDSKTIAALRAAFEKHQSGNGRWPRSVERGSDGGYILQQSEVAWMNWIYAVDAIDNMGWLNVPD